MSIKITVSLASEVCDDLMHYADENDLTLSKAVNEVLLDYFEANEEDVKDEVDAEIDDEDEEIDDEHEHEDDHME